MTIKRIHIYFFCLITALSGVAQAQNPFEIKSRLNQDSLETTLPVQAEVPETDVSGDQPGFSNSRTTDQKASQVTGDNDEINQVIDSTNPFEVDRQLKATKVKEEKPEALPTSKEVQKIRKKQTEKNDSKPVKGGNFLFWIILFAFLILAVGLSLDRWFISKIFRGIFNYNLSNTLMRETSGLKIIILAVLYLMFIVTTSLFVFLVYRYYSGQGEIVHLLYSFGLVAGIYLVRHTALFLFYYIFPTIQVLASYSYSIVTFNIVAGISLMVPILVMAFSPEPLVTVAMIAGFVIFGLLLILRSIRGLLISFEYLNNHPIHFFLYLCAFEIIPLMVVYKVLTDFV